MTTVATVASGLSKRYGRRQPWVIDHLDLRFEPGTLTVVGGANGCGKSTLLRVLAGVSRPTEGLITQRPRQVGYVPERLPARLQMTGREYLAHMGRLRSLDSTYAARRSEDLAARLSLNPSLDVRVRSLSKGNSQKVSLAQAFLAPVGLLLLDEPWSGLDASASEGLREEVSSARREGTAVVATSHRADAIPGSDRYLLLSGGHLRELVPPDAPGTRAQVVVELVAPHHFAGGDGPPSWMPHVEAAPLEGVWRVSVLAGPTVDQLLAHALSAGWSVHRVDPGTLGAAFIGRKEVSPPSEAPEVPPADEAPERPWASS